TGDRLGAGDLEEAASDLGGVARHVDEGEELGLHVLLAITRAEGELGVGDDDAERLLECLGDADRAQLIRRGRHPLASRSGYRLAARGTQGETRWPGWPLFRTGPG